MRRDILDPAMAATAIIRGNTSAAASRNCSSASQTGSSLCARRISTGRPSTECRRLTWIAVLGAPETAKAKYEASAYAGGSWQLVYQLDPPLSVVPKGKGLKDAHMFGPEWLLSKTPVSTNSTP